MTSSLEIDVSASAVSLGGAFGDLLRSQSNRNNLPSKDAHINELLDRRESSEAPTICSFPISRIDTLGHGSSAVVYKSVRLHSLEVCAEKVVGISDPSKRSQLRRELEFLKQASLSSSNSRSRYVVGLLEVVNNPFDGTLSICLEYMNGGSLLDVVRAGGCPDELNLASYAYQLFAGLEFLHSLRLIHRDIKPSNALISSSGQVKLADFGLSKSLEAGQSLAETFVGTFDYMAPERLTGDAYSFSSDVWSLGLTMHTVAVGYYPYGPDRSKSSSLQSSLSFSGKDITDENGDLAKSTNRTPKAKKLGFWELLHATQEGDIPLPNASQFSHEFIDFISKACAKEVSDRRSAKQLLELPFLSRGQKVATRISESGQEQGSSDSLSSNRDNCVDRASNQERDVGSIVNKASGNPTSGPPKTGHALNSRDLARLVSYWQRYVLELRERGAGPQSAPGDLSSYKEASTSADDRNQNRNQNPSTSVHPHKSAQGELQNGPVVFVTATKLKNLAEALNCDYRKLHHLFCKAIKHIEKDFVGSVSVLDEKHVEPKSIQGLGLGFGLDAFTSSPKAGPYTGTSKKSEMPQEWFEEKSAKRHNSESALRVSAQGKESITDRKVLKGGCPSPLAGEIGNKEASRSGPRHPSRSSSDSMMMMGIERLGSGSSFGISSGSGSGSGSSSAGGRVDLQRDALANYSREHSASARRLDQEEGMPSIKHGISPSKEANNSNSARQSSRNNDTSDDEDEDEDYEDDMLYDNASYDTFDDDDDIVFEDMIHPCSDSPYSDSPVPNAVEEDEALAGAVSRLNLDDKKSGRSIAKAHRDNVGRSRTMSCGSLPEDEDIIFNNRSVSKDFVDDEIRDFGTINLNASMDSLAIQSSPGLKIPLKRKSHLPRAHVAIEIPRRGEDDDAEDDEYSIAYYNDTFDEYDGV